jgi:hypothetical protein
MTLDLAAGEIRAFACETIDEIAKKTEYLDIFANSIPHL